MLPVLAEAGVVDAGGTGFVLLLDAALLVVDGRPVPEPRIGEGAVRADAHLVQHTGDEHGHGDVSDLRYEVMYFLEADDAAIPHFKDVWAGIGDSIVVVGGDGLWNCHIHTDDIGAAIEAALDAGRPCKIRVTDLMEQVVEERWVREATGEAIVRGAAAHPRAGDHRGRGGGRRRRHQAHLLQPRRAGHRGRRPVDEPVDRRAARPRSRRCRPTRS